MIGINPNPHIAPAFILVIKFKVFVAIQAAQCIKCIIKGFFTRRITASWFSTKIL